MKCNRKNANLLLNKGVSIASLAAVVLYPCLFIYFQNAGEAALKDIWRVATGLLAASFFAFILINSVYLHDSYKSVFAVNIGMLIFLNFAFIEKVIISIFSGVFYWHVIIIFVFLWLILLITLKKKKLSIAKTINHITFAIFFALILTNAILAIPSIINKINNINKDHPENYFIEATEESYPNIYYFIFDEYGGIDNLKRYCGYDNSPFYDRLREIGFNVSEHSRNESNSTYTVIPNLLNINYVNHGFQSSDQDDIAIRLENMKSPELFRILLAYGYKINILDSCNFLDKAQSSFSYDPSYSGVEGSADYYILQRTALYPFYRNSSSSEINNLQQMIEYAARSPELSASNLFTIGYFKYPHNPWFVDENGNAISGADRVNYYNTDIYLGALKYGNKFIEKIVLSIIDQDPDSIIILQSDHGFRWTLFGPAEDNEDTKMFYMCNILNSVYFKGEYLDIEGQTGINTLRMVLNKLLDTGLEMIDENDYNKLLEKK